jgi:hypothetical protein
MEEVKQECDELKEFLDVERRIILKHIDSHKWFNGIADKNEAIADFISRYAWLIRETYCMSICGNSKNCAVLDSLEEK